MLVEKDAILICFQSLKNPVRKSILYDHKKFQDFEPEFLSFDVVLLPDGEKQRGGPGPCFSTVNFTRTPSLKFHLRHCFNTFFQQHQISKQALSLNQNTLPKTKFKAKKRSKHQIRLHGWSLRAAYWLLLWQPGTNCRFQRNKSCHRTLYRRARDQTWPQMFEGGRKEAPPVLQAGVLEGLQIFTRWDISYRKSIIASSLSYPAKPSQAPNQRLLQRRLHHAGSLNRLQR